MSLLKNNISVCYVINLKKEQFMKSKKIPVENVRFSLNNRVILLANILIKEKEGGLI